MYTFKHKCIDLYVIFPNSNKSLGNFKQKNNFLFFVMWLRSSYNWNMSHSLYQKQNFSKLLFNIWQLDTLITLKTWRSYIPFLTFFFPYVKIWKLRQVTGKDEWKLIKMIPSFHEIRKTAWIFLCILLEIKGKIFKFIKIIRKICY